jgi:hypothetical protein
MQFSEADRFWQSVPRWAEFLIKCGFIWGDGPLGMRRIGIVSMPCESAAAGLVALGAMRYRLSLAGANDSVSHFERIKRLAMRSDVETFLRHETHTGRFRLEGKDKEGIVWVRRETARTSKSWNRNGPLRTIILPSNANDWRFDGEAPMQTAQGAELPYGPFYQELVEGAGVPIPTNLTQSDSGICIAGRVAGESVSKSILAGIRFQSHGYVTDLASLLTVQSWSPDTISRVTFFNARTGQIDRSTGSTRLVVCDGDAAFLRVIESAEFRKSDIVGVMHRDVERDRLESIGVKIADLAQWYAPDTELLEGMPSTPRGIAISTLKRR